jgi:hypothetical protein
MKVRDIIKKYRLRMESELTGSNPNMADDEWARAATHWKCTIKRGRGRMIVFFSQGPAIVHEPSLEELLDTLGSDASGYLNARGFEDWASEYGYDPDSRRAERMWKAVGQQVADLRRLLGDGGIEELAFKTERL